MQSKAFETKSWSWLTIIARESLLVVHVKLKMCLRIMSITIDMVRALQLLNTRFSTINDQIEVRPCGFLSCFTVTLQRELHLHETESQNSDLTDPVVEEEEWGDELGAKNDSQEATQDALKNGEPVDKETPLDAPQLEKPEETSDSGKDPNHEEDGSEEQITVEIEEVPEDWGDEEAYVDGDEVIALEGKGGGEITRPRQQGP